MASAMMLPHSKDAERAVLGAMFLGSDAVDKAISILSPGDFYVTAHAIIFKTMLKIFLQGKAVDQLTVIEDLKPDLIKQTGGYDAVLGISESMPSAANIDEYIRIVREKSQERKTVIALQESLQNLQSGGKVDDVQGVLLGLFDTFDPGGYRGVAFALREAEAMAKDQSRGLMTGFTDLDNLTGGLRQQDLIVLAARPSMGKTSLALRIAHNVAKRGKGVAFVSLESSSASLAERLLFQVAKIDSHRYYGSYLAEEERHRVAGTFKSLKALPLWLDETAVLNIDQIHSRARRLKAQHGLDLLVIDYLQLISGSGKISRNEAVGEYSRGAKRITKDLDIPVILISQLSRAVESRPNKLPQLSDLRDSGSIEQDADLVLLLYRPEFYGFTFDKDGQRYRDNLAQVIIAKSRNGRRGTVELSFFSEYTLFTNHAPEVDYG